MALTRSDYGPNPHAGAQRNNAAERGWGPGWPAAQVHKMVRVSAVGTTIYVRREIAPLVAVLMAKTEQLYRYDINPLGEENQTWGFANRPIRGTRTASNHSWGLAVDINSLHNPMGSVFRSDIPPAVVKMWEGADFYWGGRFTRRPDAMHLEYIGRPSDVVADYATALAWGEERPRSPEWKPKPGDVTVRPEAIRRAVRGEPVSHEWAHDVHQFMASLSPAGAELIPWTTFNKWHRDRSWKRGVWFAVIRLQQYAGLVADGIYGPKTADALRRLTGLLSA